MTVVRITIKKILTASANSYRQFGDGEFSSEYLVQTDASFPSAQLETYALNLAQAESRLFPTCVRFKSATVKLATPGATAEILRGQFSSIWLSEIRGQWEMGEGDGLAFPPVTGVYIRQTLGRCGRLSIPHALSAAEWNLYAQKRVVPLRFQRQSASGLGPSSVFSHELMEAVRGSNGTHIMPSVAGDDAGRLRLVLDFHFSGFEASSSRPKRKGARKTAQRRSNLANVEAESDSLSTRKATKIKEPVEGVVYLLQAGQHFKIGKSIVFDKRLTQIKLQLPYRVEVVHTISAANPSSVETYWHRRFAARRQNGEWFELTEAEVNEFKSVSKM